MTVNGKLDIRSLPAIERGEGEPYEGPANALEEQLVELWAELLRLEKEKISVNKSFFELGGHSLKAIALTSQMSKLFSVKIPLIEFFKAPTVRQLAAAVLADRSAYQHCAIPAAPERASYPLSFPQRRLYLLNQLDPDSLAYNMPYTVRLEGEIDVELLRETFRQLIGRHESLRTSFHLEDGQPVQRIAADAAFDLVVKDVADSTEDVARGMTVSTEEIVREFIRPFRLDQAPLLRVALIKETTGKAVLVVDMHHIISDGVSQQLLMKDFQSFYRGEQPVPLAIQYKDYAWWQQSQPQLADIQRQQDFWLQKFSPLPDAISLPADRPRPPVKRYEGGMVQLRLSPRQVKALKQLAESQGCTLFTLLLSAYSLLLSKLSGSEDIVIGTSTAGRQHADLQNVMGMFVNTLPLRTFPKGDGSFAAFLAAVQTDSLACFDHQAYPYEELIDRLRLERDTSRNPLFEAMFSYQNLEATGESTPGLQVTSYESDHRVSKFDLTLAVNEGEGQLRLGFEYASALFEEETIERFAGYYGRILSAVAADPDIRLSELRL
jgi:acyl carrier protein